MASSVQTITADIITKATLPPDSASSSSSSSSSSSASTVTIDKFYLLPTDPTVLQEIQRAFAQRLIKQQNGSEADEAKVIYRLVLAIFDDYENHAQASDASNNRFNQEKAVQFLMTCVGTDQTAKKGLKNCATLWSAQEADQGPAKLLGDAIIKALSPPSVEERSYKGVAIVSFIATSALAVLGVLMLLNPMGWGTALTGGGLAVSTMFIAGSACIGIGGVGALGSAATALVLAHKKKPSLEIIG